MEEATKIYKSPASISSEFLSDMITKLIEDSGTEEKVLNDDMFGHEEADDEDAAISDLTKPDMSTIKTPIGNPAGPATAGLVLLIPSTFNHDIVKDAIIGQHGREHRKLLMTTRCNHIRFKDCSILEGFSCFVAFSHSTEFGAKKASIRIAGLIAEKVEPLNRREFRRTLKLWSCNPETVAVGGLSFVLEEDLALKDVEDRQKGRALYEFALSRLASKTKKSGIIVYQRSPYDLTTKVHMSLIEFPATMRRRNACAAALIGTNGSNKKRVEETCECKLEIILDGDTIGEPYVLITANARDKAVAGVNAVIETFKNVLRPLSGENSSKKG